MSSMNSMASASGADAASGGFFRVRKQVPTATVIVVAGALALYSTSSDEPARVWDDHYVLESTATNSGVHSARQRAEALVERATEHSIDSEHAEATRAGVVELRRLSGLTWEQIGELFGVSRRSIHFWASGKALSAGNETRLLRILDVVRRGSRATASQTRLALLEPTYGISPFDLLVELKFQEAGDRLGLHAAMPSRSVVPLSAEARLERIPLSPEELVDAQHERVHRDVGISRAARTARAGGRGSA